jgi:hypothetical protein
VAGGDLAKAEIRLTILLPRNKLQWLVGMTALELTVKIVTWLFLPVFLCTERADEWSRIRGSVMEVEAQHYEGDVGRLSVASV